MNKFFLLLMLILTGCTSTSDNRHFKKGVKESFLTERCRKPKIINLSEDSWNGTDQKTLNKSYDGCRRIYSELHCPRVFYKMAKNTYRVICYKLEV